MMTISVVIHLLQNDIFDGYDNDINSANVCSIATMMLVPK